jgi:hypothetical protein
MSTTITSAAITYSRYGGPDVLTSSTVDLMSQARMLGLARALGPARALGVEALGRATG